MFMRIIGGNRIFWCNKCQDIIGEDHIVVTTIYNKHVLGKNPITYFYC